MCPFVCDCCGFFLIRLLLQTSRTPWALTHNIDFLATAGTDDIVWYSQSVAAIAAADGDAACPSVCLAVCLFGCCRLWCLLFVAYYLCVCVCVCVPVIAFVDLSVFVISVFCLCAFFTSALYVCVLHVTDFLTSGFSSCDPFRCYVFLLGFYISVSFLLDLVLCDVMLFVCLLVCLLHDLFLCACFVLDFVFSEFVLSVCLLLAVVLPDFVLISCSSFPCCLIPCPLNVLAFLIILLLHVFC